MSGPLTGTASLVRLVLRRDRIRLPIWILGIAGIVYYSAALIPGVYSTPEEIQAYESNLGSSAAGIALSGPPVALDTLGGILVFETSATALIAIALMAIFLVVRHTRDEEEEGRTELVRSAVVGRHAHLSAALIVVSIGCCAVGIGVFASFLSADVPTAGSLVYAAAVTAFGIVFACIGAVAAQLMTTARGAIGLSASILGVIYVIRAIGDIRENWLVWLSPMSWSHQVLPFDENRWWPLGISLVLAAASTGAAVALANRRDLGAGIVPARPGTPVAAPWLSGPVGLTFRLQRGSIIGWTIGMLVGGATTGAFTQDVENMMEDNPTLAEYLEALGQGTPVEMYLSTMLFILSLLAAGFAVSSALRLRSEESTGRLEPVLATAVSRSRWMAGSLLVTLVGTVVVLAAGGLGAGLSHGVVSDDLGAAAAVLRDSLVYLPAALTLAALAVLLFGWIPRFAAAAWAAFVACFLIGYLGGLLDFPEWVNNVSPFTHTPGVPLDEVTVAPLATITLLVVIIAAVGLLGFRRRDIG